MKRILKKVFILFLLFLNLEVIIKADEGMIIQADSYILMEKTSKRVLYEKNMDNRYLTASIVKILTAIVAIENIDDLEKYVTVELDTTRQTGSSIYLKEGDKIKIIDLLYGMLLRSGNDAAYLLAKSTFNDVDRFVGEMNNLAKKIGMCHSSFTNPTGLDEENCNYSTSYDMALLMCYALNNKVFSKVTSTAKHTSKTYNGELLYFVNKHKLVLNDEYVTGGKTGYTKKAKRTLVTSAKKDNMELIAVTFNCGDDWNVHRKLFEYGFSNYKIKTILKRQIIEIDEQYYSVTPYLPKDLKYPVKENEEVKCKIYLLKNPLEKVIGKASIIINGKEMYSSEIYRYY